MKEKSENVAPSCGRTNCLYIFRRLMIPGWTLSRNNFFKGLDAEGLQPWLALRQNDRR